MTSGHQANQAWEASEEMSNGKLSIKKLEYSSNPWRLVAGEDEEIYTDEVFDHPYLGKTKINSPVCGETKTKLIENILLLLENLSERLHRAKADLKILNDSIERSGFDLSPCMYCGAAVICIPDGLPCCKVCAAKEGGV